MDAQQNPDILINRQAWQRLTSEIKAFAASEAGGWAKCLFALLIALLLSISGLNVLGSYVGRDFMTAIENRNMGGFILQALILIGVFSLTTVAAIVLRFHEERLGLAWREWLTRRLVDLYLARGIYYRLDAGGTLSNPDERIAEDVRVFTTTTLSFALMILNSSITVLAFSGVLWSISPTLFVVSVLYAVGGSYGSFHLGRLLAGLNYSQLDKEANFRAELIHIRENAESVALLHREEQLKDRLLRRIEDLVANFRRIIVVNRSLGFYSTGYNYLIQIIPALVVAPLFIHGQAQFGVIAQAAIAFAQLTGAFSLVVTNFPSLSNFTAVIVRLGLLRDSLDESGECSCVDADIDPVGKEAPMGIETCECVDSNRVVYEGLTLLAPQSKRLLLKELSVTISYGTRLLIAGTNEDAKAALFRATAGIWGSGEGRICRPESTQIYFLPERPYLPLGTLRELLMRTGQEPTVLEQQILATLGALKLLPIVQRVGGLDVPRDWKGILSLEEQQFLAFARLLLAAPRFAFLDRIRTSLDSEGVALVLKMLNEKSITYLTLGRSRHGHRDSDDKPEDYDAILELKNDGDWSWNPF